MGLGLAWGAYFVDDTYEALGFGQRGLTYFAAEGAASPALTSILWAGVVGLTGLPVDLVAWVLSVVGWGVLVLVVWRVTPAGSIFIATTPFLITSLGTEWGWFLAGGWFLLGDEGRRTEDGRRIGLLALILAMTHFSWATLLFLLLVIVAKRRGGWLVPLGSLLVGFVVSLWAGGWQWLSLGQFDIMPLWEASQQLFQQSELYLWLLLLAGLGYWFLWRDQRRFWPLVVWVVAAGVLGEVVVVMVGLLVPAGFAIHHLLTLAHEKNWTTLPQPMLYRVGSALLILPLLVAHVAVLSQQWSARPVAQWQLENALASWLIEHSAETDTVFAAPRLTYLANRPIPATPLAENGATLVRQIGLRPPSYVVSTNTLPWQQLTRSAWFVERYSAVQLFSSPYEAASPYTLWAYEPSVFDEGERQEVAIELAPNGVAVVGYQVSSPRIAAGEATHLTLYLQATRPVTQSFNTVVRVVSETGEAFAQRDLLTPRSMPVAWWEPGQIIAERYVLTTTQEISYGAYELNVSFRPTDDLDLYPLSRPDEPAELDRAFLNHIAIPYTGDLARATPLGATFSDQITLDGYELRGEVAPGNLVEVALYWGALRPPEGEYTVFVHLLDRAGAFVVGQDGRPVSGRFTTRAWRPGDVVFDVHWLELPPDLPAGTYQLNVGLYVAETGIRVVVFDPAGVEQPNHTLPIHSVEIP